jgi:hypothetical protein
LHGPVVPVVMEIGGTVAAELKLVFWVTAEVAL